MSRVRLSINVSDFDAAVAFYSRLFGTTPAKLRAGYANFALDDPPLKLVLNAPGGTINHLGVEVGSAGEVAQAGTRLDAAGLDTEPEPGAVCCYARQDKVWAHDPDGVAWEYYTVLEHIIAEDIAVPQEKSQGTRGLQVTRERAAACGARATAGLAHESGN
jgi:catechol 2,3-dioxygenase-like lactoylglutathione lyase family enzyme